MSLSVGIVGLPNSGKSTLFNALTRSNVQASPHMFTTIDPNLGIVTLSDHRLKPISEIFESRKRVPADVTFVDVAGLIRGAHRGEGLGNKFLGQLRNVDALCMVLRCFGQKDVPLSLGELNPVLELEILETELILADLEVVERALEKRARSVSLGEKKYLAQAEALEMARDALSRGIPARKGDIPPHLVEQLREFSLITMKQGFIVANISEDDISSEEFIQHNELAEASEKRGMEVVPISSRLECELSQLEADEAEVFAGEMGLDRTALDRVAETGYQSLDLITFYTGNRNETRAWSLPRGSTAINAAGMIHTDMARGFIRAEVIKADQLIKTGSYTKARDLGIINLAGKDYPVEDRDVLLIRFNL